MTDKEHKLFTEFKPVSTAEWEAKINADLKGKDYDRALVWKTDEGFNVRPYYREESLLNLPYLDNLPGEFPFVRGNKNSGNDWLIRQDIHVKDFQAANKKALDILGKGVTSLGWIFDNCAGINASQLDILFKGICLDAVEVNFICSCSNTKHVEVLADYISRGKWDNNKIMASGSYDPIGNYVLKGKLDSEAFSKCRSVIEKTKGIENFRALAVHGTNFANSGSSIAQELAFSLAQGAEYLTRLTDEGLSVDVVAQSLKFNFGISNNYFMEIAKLRAGRLLWAHIVKAYSPQIDSAAKLIAHSETNSYNKTIYDPYVNMLRTQTEAMSAILGGAESVTVLPFNSIYETATEFSERIARNQQSLLMEESHFDKIADPAAGSYYIETLTSSLAEQAWKLFLEVQDKGGFIESFKQGFIQSGIKAMAAKREDKIAHRRENLLGTNQFPNFSEQIKTEFDAAFFTPIDLTSPDADTETLKPYRAALPFEALRYKTDIFAIKNKRPVAFMLTIGNLAFRKARAQFSCNFFAVAGFEVIDNNGFETIEQGVSAARDAGADIVVVCSSDDEYADLAPEIAGSLGNEILVVAGSPACKPELEAKGITNFIHMKSNLLEELKGYQSKLGI